MSDAYSDATPEEKQHVVKVLTWIIELYKLHIQESEAQAPETEVELAKRVAEVRRLFAANEISPERFVARLGMNKLRKQIDRLELLRHVHKELSDNHPAAVSSDVLATAGMLLQNVMFAIVVSSEFADSEDKHSTAKLMLIELAEAIRLVMPTDFFFGNFDPLKTKF